MQPQNTQPMPPGPPPQPTPAPQLTPPQPDPAAPTPTAGPTAAGSSKKLIMWVTVGIIILVIAGVAAYLLTRPKKTADNNSTPSTSTTSPSTPGSSPSATTLATTAYNGTGFSIKPPAGWHKVTTDLIKADVIFATTDAITTTNSTDVAMVFVLDVPNTNKASLKQLADASVTSQQKALTNFKLINRADITAGGRPAILNTISYEQGQYSYKNYLLMTLKDNKVFVITGAATTGNWDKYSDVLKQSLLSFN